MKDFLGTTPVDVANHPEFSKWTASDYAMQFISEYGRDDGAQHKDWVLDQVARILKGSPVLVSEARWASGKAEFRFEVGAPSAEYQAWHEAS